MHHSLITLAVILLMTTGSFAAEPALVYQGDGVELRLDAVESGKGTIIFRGVSYPFVAEAISGDDSLILSGAFSADGTEYSFNAKRDTADGPLTFTTGTTTYKLLPAKPQAENPLDRRNGPAPAQNNLDKSAPNTTSAKPAQLKLKQIEFQDRDMNNVVSHTMLIPENWTATGGVLWSRGDIVHPQQQIEIKSPDGLRIAFIPAMQFTYIETDPNWIAEMRNMGMDTSKMQAKQGMQPPQDVGAWVISFIQQNNRAVSDATLISQRRDEKFEEGMKKFGNPGNADIRAFVLTIEYVKDGVRTREEISLSLMVSPPIDGGRSKFQMWGLYTSGIISAPADRFEESKSLLYSIANTLRSKPQWWAAVQDTLAAINRIRQKGIDERIAASWEAIRKRGETYNQISDDQMASWRRQQSNDDEMQRRRVNTVNDTADYWLPDSNTTVKLPGRLYKNAYQTKQGDYILTDSTLDSPDVTLLKERE